MQGVSLFSSAGIAETYLSQIGIKIVAANELLKERAELHRSIFPETKMIQGNILNDQICLGFAVRLFNLYKLFLKFLILLCMSTPHLIEIFYL